MPAKTTPARKAKVPKTIRYKTIGRTSDGIAVLKPKTATSSPSALGTKVARLMAEGRRMKTAPRSVKGTEARKAKQAAT